MLLNTVTEAITSKKGLLTTIACSLPNEPPHYALEGSIFIGGASMDTTVWEEKYKGWLTAIEHTKSERL